MIASQEGVSGSIRPNLHANDHLRDHWARQVGWRVQEDVLLRGDFRICAFYQQ